MQYCNNESSHQYNYYLDSKNPFLFIYSSANKNTKSHKRIIHDLNIARRIVSEHSLSQIFLERR